jgi:hypothetical protein
MRAWVLGFTQVGDVVPERLPLFAFPNVWALKQWYKILTGIAEQFDKFDDRGFHTVCVVS